MSQYIVSARKYRPDSFGTLIGQDTIARTLSNSIKRGQLAHAYLFCGPRGVGKTTTARIFAKMINCSSPGPDMEPCGHCESCVSFQEGRSYCIHEMDAASNNSVDDMKALMDKVQVPPQVGKYSVYIIDEVHMLSQAAFNAFLKTLEEPPAHAIFILATTEKHKILPTILSRCQTYDFNRISISDMVRNLRDIAAKEGVSIDDESLHVIAMKADGAMRDALTIFDQTVAFCGTDVHYADVIRNLNVLDYEYSFALVDNFLTGSYGEALLSFDQILSKGFNALHFVASLSTHLRDLIVSRTGGLDALLELPDSLKKRYAEQAARCPLGFLYEALNVTTACEAGYKAAVNPRLHIEFMLMKLCFLQREPEVASPRPVPQAAPVQAPKPAPEKPAPAPEKPAPVPEKPAPAPEKPSPALEKPAPEPAPVSENPAPAEPAPKPAPRRRVRSGAALSIENLTGEKETEVSVEVPAAEDGTKKLTAENLPGYLKEIARQYEKTQSRFAVMLSTAPAELGEDDGVPVVTLFVKNAAQKKWIEDTKVREIQRHLCNLASLRKVNIAVELEQVDESAEKPLYMPEDQARDLMEKNQAVQHFVSTFGLDVK